MQNVKFKAVYLGKASTSDNGRAWEHFRWNISINGVDFDYKTGVGHFTPFMRGKYGDKGRNKKPERDTLQNAELRGWLHVPTLLDVAESLLLDMDSGQESFDNFCSNLGYDNDSLSALDIYRACMALAPKVRQAFGKDLDAVRAAVEERNA